VNVRQTWQEQEWEGMGDSEAARDEASLLDLARQLGQAWAVQDVTKRERLIDDPYFHTDASGRTLGRAEWLADVPRQGQRPTITFDDAKVQIIGPVAVMTGRNVVTMTADGNAVERALRFTQVWRRHGAAWRRAIFQATWIAAR
jgi:ketosteroid isomerase-like protein